MTLIRSLLFTTLFYANLIIQMIVFAPAIAFAGSETIWAIVRRWARSSLWLLKVIAGTKAKITGQDRIPAGPAIIAAKHQSFWEVFALLPEVDRATFILKKELMAIPLFGWYARRLGMIPVDRAKRGATLASILAGAQRAVAEGRQIVIFPEGTRTPAGADPVYRPGVHFLYTKLGIPVVPVALNSGLYWPRRNVRRQRGTILAEFLPAIPPGLDRDVMLTQLRAEIETRSVEMLREAMVERPDLPVGDLVTERLGRSA